MASNLQKWKRLKNVKPLLPSGADFVTIRRLTLDELAAEDALSEDLLAAVVLELQPGGSVAEMARLQTEGATEKVRQVSRDMLRVRDAVVLRAVVEPELTEADLDDLDPLDKAMIADLASGQTDMDAAGRRVWGIEPLNTFQAFRDKHGCDESCPSCQEVVREFSTAQL